MTIFLDFDGTLFDTEKFRDFLLKRGNSPEPYKFDTEELAQFLYSDTKSFLQGAGEHNLVLVTAGDEAFQRAKIKSSGITEFFNELLFTGEEAKGEVIKEMLSKESNLLPAIFVDDRVSQLESVATLCPEVQVVRMMREGNPQAEKKSEAGYKEASRLTELLMIL